MNAEIIAIGTELLLGFVVNTDTAYLGRVLAELGIDCYHQVTVGDNRRRLSEAIRTALGRADLVITCGGLGPTVDDITLETIAQTTGKTLRLNPSVLRAIEGRFRRFGVRMPASNKRQALVPEGAAVFPNNVGTAPGFLLPLRGSTGSPRTETGSPRMRWLVALPGPPVELIPMAEKYLIPCLKRFTGTAVIRSRTLKATGLTESEVDAKVKKMLGLRGAVTVGIYAHPGQIDLRITAKAQDARTASRLVNGLEAKIHRRLGNLIFGADEETLEGEVGKLLKKKRLTLGTAESCTGGFIGHRLTEIPGSSDYFLGGVVSYSNKLKTAALNVSPALLKKYGAVSPQAAEAMAAAVRRLTGADLGLAVTGIAGPSTGLRTGPSGGTKKKPVGLVYIALSGGRKTRVKRHLFSGTRTMVKLKASQAALNMLRLRLLSGGR